MLSQSWPDFVWKSRFDSRSGKSSETDPFRCLPENNYDIAFKSYVVYEHYIVQYFKVL